MDKKRGTKSILLDLLFLFIIIGGLSASLYFTIWNAQSTESDAPTLPEDEAEDVTEGSIEFTIPPSETSESSSPYENIRIMTDVSNDKHLLFAIQYPITAFENVNKEIQNTVEGAKHDYIKQMNKKIGKLNEKLTGELNIAFDIQEFNEAILSFLVQTKMTLPGEETTTTYESYVFHQETGEFFSLTDLINLDSQSEVTLKTQLKDLLITNGSNILYSAEEFKTYIKNADLTNLPFILSDEHIQFYFNDLINTTSKTPLHIVVPLTSINAILVNDYQQQMVEEEETIAPVETEKKYIALTFDDGPHPDVTPHILNTLKKYNAKATFFMLGSRVQHYPEIARQVYSEGHEIGNHTWNHPKLTNLTDAEIMREYTTTEQVIIEAIGVPSTIFRPPYGATNANIKALIPSVQFNWTIDTEDWKHRDAKKLLPSVKSTLHPNAVVLMHDIHLSTANGLDAVLHYLQQEGYEFVTISEILNAN